MSQHLPLAVLGISHKTAPVEIRERVALSEDEQKQILTLFKQDEQTQGAFVLSTCNRTELYISSENHTSPIRLFQTWFLEHKAVDYFRGDFAYLHTGYNALRHFFQVISSMDSQIVGETQITGQVKNAFSLAFDLQATDSLLNKVFNFGQQAQKKVRNDTYLCQGAVSISFAGVELAEKIFNRLEDRTVLLIGAGETAELCAEHFRKKGVARFHVVNRTLDNAVKLAEKFSGQAFVMENLEAAFDDVDIVISATASKEYVLTHALAQKITKKRKNRPLFLIDLAMPRDIDPAISQLDEIYLYNLDDLTEIVKLNTEKRQNEIPKAHKALEAVVKDFDDWFATYSMSSTISQLKSYFENIFRGEIKKAAKNLNQDAQATLDELEKNLTNKLVRQHVKLLKKNNSASDQLAHIEMIHNLIEME